MHTPTDSVELIARVRNDPRVPKGPGASDEEIRAAEQAIGLFPADYRAFLAAFGWIELRTETLYGLGPSIRDGYQLVAGTQCMRRWDSIEWPDHFAYLADLGTGDGWIVLLDADEDGHHPVLFADVHLGELGRCADCFTEWLHRILDDPDLLLSSTLPR